MAREQIAPVLSAQPSKLPVRLQLATALRFLAIGTYQGAIGKDCDINLHRTTVCKILWRVINAIEGLRSIVL